MTLSAKRRWVHLALVLFTLWPLAHMLLVKKYDLSAWKLAGWGMYATPRPEFSGVAVWGRRPGASQFEEIRPLPERWLPRAKAYLDKRRWLGRLLPPHDLARSFPRRPGEFADLRVIVYTPTLDRRSHIVVVVPVVYEYAEAALR